MAWLDDILDAAFGGGNSSSSQAVATGGNANVTVSPTIVNSIDVAPLEEPLKQLGAIFALGQAAQAEAIATAGDRIAAAQIAGQQTQAQQFNSLATWVSLGGLAIALLRLLGAFK